MAESTPATAKDASPGAENEPATPDDDPPPYPYLRLLHQLQSKAVRAQGPAAAPADDDDDQEGKFESLSDILQSEQQQRAEAEQPWDLSADALLATLLHEFSSHVAARSYRAASEIRVMQDDVNRGGVDVAVCQTEFLRRSGDYFMEQVVEDDDESDSDSEGDDEGEDGDEDGDGEAAADESATRTDDGPNLRGDDDDGSDDSSADIARLEAEERSAIAAGMKALELFYDPKRPRPGRNSSSGGGSGSGGSGGEGGGEAAADAEEDVIGENCYYYPAAEGDGFNQRPLPFIIGSREFMESSCAGLGG